MDIRAIYDRGFQYRCDGLYPEARTEFEKALSIDPNFADAKWQIGLIQGFEGDFDGSLVTLQDAVRISPNHQNARYDLAMTFMMLGMYDEACGEFKTLLKQNPNHEKALQQVIYCP